MIRARQGTTASDVSGRAGDKGGIVGATTPRSGWPRLPADDFPQTGPVGANRPPARARGPSLSRRGRVFPWSGTRPVSALAPHGARMDTDNPTPDVPCEIVPRRDATSDGLKLLGLALAHWSQEELRAGGRLASIDNVVV